MKKIFTSKAFIISILAVLCIGIAAACFIWGRDRPSEFTPDSVESQTTDEWKEGTSSSESGSWSTPGSADGENKPEEEYPKVVEETEDEVVVDFTPPKDKEDAEPPAAPEGKTEIENPEPDHPQTIDPEITVPEPEPSSPSGPAPGSTNDNGEVYDPVFGWVKPGVIVQENIDSDGDPNKMVGNMG